MCIKKKIAELQEQIDAKLKLKSLLEKTQPLLTSISVICSDYREVAPEELPFLMDEIIAAAQVDLSVAAISAIASTGDEKAQDFALDAMTQAIEQRISAAFTENVEEELALDEPIVWSVMSEDKKWRVQFTSHPNKIFLWFQSKDEGFTEIVTTEEWEQYEGSSEKCLESILKQRFSKGESSEVEYEPDECTDSISNILLSKGFYEPDVNLADVYDPEDKQGSYQGWDIYCSVHDSGQAMGIGLGNEQLEQFWDVGTEFLSDHDSSFPKSLSEKQPILDWVRSVIDLLPKENLEVPGQLKLDFQNVPLIGEEYDAAVEDELALDDEDIPELGGNWEIEIESKAAPEEPTKLQQLLEGTSNFVFDKLGAKVKINSEFIENNHGEEPEVTEEALFTVTDRDGGKVQHYYHSAEDLIEYKPIAGWNPLGNLMNTAEAYAKKWVKEQSSEVEPSNLIKEFLITNLPLPHQEMRARVTPAIADGKFAGATFTFYRGTEELFSTSQTADEIARGENNSELIAVALAKSWLNRQELKNVSPTGTTHTEPPAKDEFTELVYLSDAVAYLKRKDTGEILTGYLGFSNKTAEGDRAPTMAKSRAVKWQEHLAGVYQLACSGPRECQRIESKNPKQPFKYELKLVKPSMGQLQGLATENFGLYPNEVASEVEEKQEEPDLLSDFELDRVADFDDLNPEFSVKYKGEYLTRIWSSLRTTAGEQPQRLWRHRLLKPGEEIELKDTEAAALHALQRTQGLA